MLNKENELDEYHEIYHSSLQIVHQAITNFTKRLNEKFDKMIDRENAREAYLKRQHETKNESVKEKASTDDGEASGSVESQEYDGNGTDGNEHAGIDDLSISVYVPKPPSSLTGKFRLEYKGKIYLSGKNKAEPGFDAPIGLFRCTLQNKKCSGRIETVKSSNGRVDIIERNAHTCK